MGAFNLRLFMMAASWILLASSNAQAGEIANPTGEPWYFNFQGLMPRSGESYQPYSYQQQGIPSSPYQSAAEDCGTKAQVQCAPSNFGGRTMCGRAVATAVRCMARNVLGKDSCEGNCGNGRDFVNCTNQQMEKCGYAKVSVDSNECKMPGAVRAYSWSPTARGLIYGHVEFVCGINKFCSVYKQPLDAPWPRPRPESCWYPAEAKPRNYDI